MNALDKKPNNYFIGCVVCKDPVEQVSSDAAVPSYVLEYLLGQNCATDGDDAIAEGVERLKEILAQHYVERGQANAIQFDINLRGYMRVIDKVTVAIPSTRSAAHRRGRPLGYRARPRVLDTWQKSDRNDALTLEVRMRELRRVWQFEVT